MKERSNKGFTLLELLVALAVVVLALFAFFRVLNSTTRVNAKNDRDIKAINLVQSEIENLRSQIKSKGNEGYLEIQDTINPKIDNPQDYDIDIEGIEIPLSSQGNDNITWVQYNNKFILNIVNCDYTNLENTTVNNQIVKAGSQLIYKKKSGNKYYTVKVTIARECVLTNDIDSEIYIYDVCVEAELDDGYLSKKVTSINNVYILSNEESYVDNSGGNQEPGDNQTPSDQESTVVELNGETKINQHHEMNIYSNWDGFIFNQGMNEHGKYVCQIKDRNNGFDHSLWNGTFKIQDVKIKIEYKPNNIKPYDIMRITVTYNDGIVIQGIHDGNIYWGPVYSSVNKLQILTRGKPNNYDEDFDAGVTLKNVIINGCSIGDVEGNKIYRIDNAENGVTIEFDGFEKNSNINTNVNNQKVFFLFE